MADISTSSRTSMDIFKAIMDNGPLSLYSANSKTRISIGTIHRHFKQLSNLGKIRVYESQRKGRKRIIYGPTIQGMISLYRKDKDFAKKIENYFLIWIEDKEFQKELETEGFDISPDNLKKSKQVFRKYMDYFSAVEEQVERIRNEEDIISHKLQIFFGSMLLSSNPTYRRLWTELYQELPGMQKSLDEHMENMIKSYREFRNNFTKQSHQKTK